MGRPKMFKSLFQNEMSIKSKDDYRIDISYGQKDWQMSAAIREIIANALDTGTEYAHSYNEEFGFCSITDSFESGLPKKAFVMGGSTKTGTEIGQFGEGLKMAMITALRLKRAISIQSVSFGVEITSYTSKEFDAELLRIVYTDNIRTCGTEVRIECTRKEYEDAVAMFLQFREGYRELDKNLYLPGGFISLLGLITEERPNLRLSYNLSDKSLTNRDRNVVKSRGLKPALEKAWAKTHSEEAIRMYLTGLTDAPESEEYKLTFEPKSKKIWIKTISEIFGGNVVFSSSTEADIKAVYKGFSVIPCPTKQVRTVLGSLGLSSSAQKTKKIKAEEVVIEKKESNCLIYPISKDYVSDWDAVRAGVEFLQNAVDVDPSNARIQWVPKDGGICIIKDNGKGIEKRHFVLGNSDKTDADIGLYGEGYKLGAAVLCRENRNPLIMTKGYTYTPSFEWNHDFNSEVFCFRFKQNDKSHGTTVAFRATEEETKKIRDHFIIFHDDVEIVTSDEILDVIRCGEGESKIYVNGLYVKSISGLFSYNVKIRNIVNSRDRNGIDDGVFSELLNSFIENTDNRQVIKEVLTGWKKNPNRMEYLGTRILYKISNTEIWREIVLDEFPNSCLESFDTRKNFICEVAGYTLLKGVPPYIFGLLGSLLPENVDSLAEKYGNGISFGNKLVFPITDDYIPNWDTSDAISEFISNAFDASSKEPKIEYDSNSECTVIEDDGKGIMKENLLIGSSGARDIGDAIGYFGEGLKLGLLAVTREKNRPVIIDTVGMSIEANLEYNSEFSTNLLTLEISKNSRKKGTVIKVPSSLDNFNEATSRFIALMKDENDKSIKAIEPGCDIYTGIPSGIYINGVLVKSFHSGIFAYDLCGKTAKSLLERDRKNIKEDVTAYQMMFSLITELKNKENIKTFLQGINTEGCYSEEQTMVVHNVFSITSSTGRKWKTIAMEMYPNSCIPSDDPQGTLLARDNHIKILNPTYAMLLLLRRIGFPTTFDAVEMKRMEDADDEIVPLSSLSASERERWNVLSVMVETEFGKSMPKKVKIKESLGAGEGTITLGMYSSLEDKVFLLRALFDENRHSFAELLGVCAHEFHHRSSSAKDRTREFENALTNYIGVLLAEKYPIE